MSNSTVTREHLREVLTNISPKLILEQGLQAEIRNFLLGATAEELVQLIPSEAIRILSRPVPGPSNGRLSPPASTPASDHASEHDSSHGSANSADLGSSNPGETSSADEADAGPSISILTPLTSDDMLMKHASTRKCVWETIQGIMKSKHYGVDVYRRLWGGPDHHCPSLLDPKSRIVALRRLRSRCGEDVDLATCGSRISLLLEVHELELIEYSITDCSLRPGQSKHDLAVEELAKYLGIEKKHVIRDISKRRHYRRLYEDKEIGPGALLCLGSAPLSIWEGKLNNSDVVLVLQYLSRFHPAWIERCASLNFEAAKLMIEGLELGGSSRYYLPDTAFVRRLGCFIDLEEMRRTGVLQPASTNHFTPNEQGNTGPPHNAPSPGGTAPLGQSLFFNAPSPYTTLPAGRQPHQPPGGSSAQYGPNIPIVLPQDYYPMSQPPIVLQQDYYPISQHNPFDFQQIHPTTFQFQNASPGIMHNDT